MPLAPGADAVERQYLEAWSPSSRSNGRGCRCAAISIRAQFPRPRIDFFLLHPVSSLLLFVVLQARGTWWLLTFVLLSQQIRFVPRRSRSKRMDGATYYFSGGTIMRK